MVSVVKLNCQKHHALTMVNFMKLNPRDHRASSLYMGQGWAQKKFIQWGRIEGLKDMNQAGAHGGPKPCIKPPLKVPFPTSSLVL